MKFDLKYGSLKSKFNLILFAYNLMIGYSEKNRENILETAFDNKKKKPRLKFNPRLALTGVRTTEPRTIDTTSVYVTAYVVPLICSLVSNQEIQSAVGCYPYLQGLQLACGAVNRTVSVNLLPGADHYWPHPRCLDQA